MPFVQTAVFLSSNPTSINDRNISHILLTLSAASCRGPGPCILQVFATTTHYVH